MRCFNCYSEFLPTLVKPLCKSVASATICRDFLSCFHYDIVKAHDQKQNLLQAPLLPLKKKNIQKWDSYNDIVPRLTCSIPLKTAQQ